MQLAALGGIDAVNFVVGYAGTLAGLLAWSRLRRRRRQGEPAGAAAAAAPRAYAMHARVSLALAASALAVWGVSSPTAPPPQGPSFSVTCVARVSDPGAVTWPASDLWDATRRAVAAGDDLVAWTEEGVAVHSLEEEAELLRNASELAASGRSYLAVTYYVRARANETGAHRWAMPTSGGGDEGGGAGAASGSQQQPRRSGLGIDGGGGGGASELPPASNVLVLFRPGPPPASAPPPAANAPVRDPSWPANLAFRYLKTHPVPIVELNVKGGPGEFFLLRPCPASCLQSPAAAATITALDQAYAKWAPSPASLLLRGAFLRGHALRADHGRRVHGRGVSVADPGGAFVSSP